MPRGFWPPTRAAAPALRVPSPSSEDHRVRVRGGRLAYRGGKVLVTDREDFRFQTGTSERVLHA